MKRNNSSFTVISNKKRLLLTSSKNNLKPGLSKILSRPKSSKILSRPKSSNKQKLPSLANSNSDYNISFVTTRQNTSKYQIDNEQLYEQTMQLKAVIKNLSQEYHELLKGNQNKDCQITQKDKEIVSIIESTNENEKETESTTLLTKIRKQTKILKGEIDDIKEQNLKLKKNTKLTRMFELSVLKEVYEEHINKINSLYNNSMNIYEENNKKFEELSQIEKTSKEQKMILNSLGDNLSQVNLEESNLEKLIALFTKKIENDGNQLKKNQEELSKLINQNENLNNDVLNSQKDPQMKATLTKDQYLIQKSNLKKEINYFKKTNQKAKLVIQELKNMNEKLLTLIKQKGLDQPKIKIKEQKKENQKPLKVEERIKYLKDALTKSRQIEFELEKQVQEYQNILKEHPSNSEVNQLEDQIEFGIDSNNPCYTDNDSNEPYQSNKFTSNQFNQFTYILFKNFEAKKISLNAAREKIIDPIISELNLNESSNPSSTTENFQNVIKKFNDKICEVLNCKNDYNSKILSIFICSLLYNCNGNLNKLIDYFNVLFSYTKEYTKEEESKLLKRIKTKYKENITKLINNINAENEDKKYISLLKMKNIIDNSNLSLKDKYIEFIFYLMKNFDDASSHWEDLLIGNLTELLKKENIMEDSMTEITNEEYIKNINEAIELIIKGINNKKKTLRELFEEILEKQTIEEESIKLEIDVISIDNFHEELKKIKVNLNDLQLSCLLTKYCINKKVNFINFSLLERDVNSSIDSKREILAQNNESLENEN